ncbi:bifunctional UDP-N-acetylglucosamine diphosphorylase/glucosamine-1-phosphate N-acetyltransferase GlmU [Buchnera aphidicola]|uniref:Bifunctional protein GlmU n=1 Tax=Buchnera aphidicola subsp. Schizaphis graminum (strain Sg) TaxID=198804 RepID=GLMU_BUCAP|nr:bifunctional UDP-N-acetylglucosamine diphosphorylase/glucosamine-1-phosphate N-acetyltransferase GlmU [Buchnera aphidicola]Q8KA74.1 RecName: Full=Bifunctional protein GlmU; Includes: RecName: Full=UDP-N-acetylglucosamine pyrophosphorylase; AltName: Full=N-acetylglucosamine-1-phosphate uridyltransferase; Includes: RecName: Full=Glucosamine-1-phosphate N-acetyltransferase [Buchnera aphidicola str. Sg (Schizaphis graminum)]AAM67599.1 UDP-N-acetylglucosamine pyrophosphorylase [Buchnera aphidicola 
MLKKEINVVILAAGKGTRMQSSYPKVLHKLGGKTILEHVINIAKSVKPKKIILVYNNKEKEIKSKISDTSIDWVIQKEQKGTGDAILKASKKFSDKDDIVVLYGDMPYISIESIKKLFTSKKQSDISLLTAYVKNPDGYGRVFKKNGKVIKIIEEQDANFHEKKIKEVYSGTFIANGKDLKRWLNQINNKNIKKEFYATDIVHFANLENSTIKTVQVLNCKEILGVNNKLQLSILEKIFRKKQVNDLLLSGVTLKDPNHFILRGILKHGKNIEIDTGVILEGNIILGNNIKIGVGSVIKNSFIDDQTEIKEYTIIENVKIGKKCIIGPFAHLRPKTVLDDQIHVGNFVEIKDSIIKKESKIKHLSYFGNSEIGSQVNIGAGSITCNYDGVNKFKTIIGDNVLIGANTKLIAPIKITKNATIAAGTTLTQDVNTPCLIYNNKEQKQKKNWKRPQKIIKKTDQ